MQKKSVNGEHRAGLIAHTTRENAWESMIWRATKSLFLQFLPWAEKEYVHYVLTAGVASKKCKSVTFGQFSPFLWAVFLEVRAENRSRLMYFKRALGDLQI